MKSSGLTVAFALAVAAAGCVITSSDDDTEGGSGPSSAEGGSGATTDTSAGSATGATAAGSADGSDDSVDETGDGGPANGRCDAFCESLVELGCDNGPTSAGCLLTCQSLTSAATCDPTAHTYFDCVETSTLSCNGAGDPVAEGCGLVYLEAIGCAVDENPNPAVVEPCSDYCDAVETAACELNGTHDECNTNCLWLGNTGTGCDGEWNDFLTCANSATVSCLLGFAVAEGCGDSFTAYHDCIDAAGGGG